MDGEVVPNPSAVAFDADLAHGLARWLSHRRHLTDPVVSNLSRPSAGYSSETIFLEGSWTEGGRHRQASLVVRMAPPAVGTFAAYDLSPQWQAQMAAASVGVPVADPVLERDPDWIGVPFILMPRLDGHIIGPLAHRDPWLRGLTTGERGLVHDRLLSALAAIHRAPTDEAPDVPRRDNGDELDFWEEYLSWSNHGSPVPSLAGALQWCRSHRPADEPPGVLLWGDVRFENMVLDDDARVRAVLDWDMTSIGAAEHDLAWFTSLDLITSAMFEQRAEGFPDRDGTVARFEELSGRPIHDLEWYETLAMVRSTAIMTRISVLRRDRGEPVMLPIEDNPILDLLTKRLT